jgi:hypothetical protein
MTVVVFATALVLTAKLAVLAPPAMLTLAGTDAATGLLLVRLTTAPDAGAAELSITVPKAELPPTTLLGFTAKELTVGAGFTVSEAVTVSPE